MQHTRLTLHWLLTALLLSLTPTAVHAAGVVGTGTPVSCSEAALDTALSGGGAISFNCGGTAIILLSATKTITSATVIDGGGQITLSGQNATRIFRVNTGAALDLRNITITTANLRLVAPG